ncbi:NADP-dependent oxidoreductase [Amycolatopsis sp. PS_44_ISF1]|uniref:NADP-dependent oxidoreductase n=1 Tax=Amycolatopsis sp. PS_44_ISF1 TaxID=2974917 RepID=UPI0028E01D4A|nr:NADP-dependent oxidoreductase [Amycolatopsis sp. PS_44_ISF1]MDT8912569.1 NADP-dependent oxidoreductase [Amycolatopsis sp. PS_44_ISF1]
MTETAAETPARIVRPTAYGAPGVLAVFEVPVPQPAAGEVVVRVRAAGVNPIDWKLYSGAFHDVEEEHQDSAGVAADELPSLGLECAGVITAAGPEVTGFAPGDEVIVFPATAAYADYVTAPLGSLIRKPAGLGWAEAGALMLAGTTATHVLHAAGAGEGDTVLVHGASGGVGLMTVQLAIARGATVIATAAERNHGRLRGFGATPVTYGPGLPDRVRAAAPGGITAAVDLVGTGEAFETSLELVADRQRIATISGDDRHLAAGIKVLGYGPGQDAGTELRNAARAELAELAGTGALQVVISAVHPLAEAAKAHQSGLDGHAPGKLVLEP